MLVTNQTVGVACMTISVSLFVHIQNHEDFIKEEVKPNNNCSKDQRVFSIRSFTVDVDRTFSSCKPSTLFFTVASLMKSRKQSFFCISFVVILGENKFGFIRKKG